MTWILILIITYSWLIQKTKTTHFRAIFIKYLLIRIKVRVNELAVNYSVSTTDMQDLLTEIEPLIYVLTNLTLIYLKCKCNQKKTTLVRKSKMVRSNGKSLGSNKKLYFLSKTPEKKWVVQIWIISLKRGYETCK